jgi:hypothetical protein
MKQVLREMEPVELDKALTPTISNAISTIGLSPFINFKEACNYELEFLKKVDSNRDKYYNAEYVDISIQRDEKYWLPLLAEQLPLQFAGQDNPKIKQTKYAPPMDIHWVWHVHMLAPVSYTADCKVKYD